MAEDGFRVILDEEVVGVVSEDDGTQVITVGIQGPAGPAQTTYTHNQNQASATWVVSHDLGRHPSVVVIDSAGSVIIPDVQYDSSNQVTIRFSAAFSGKAYLN